MKKVLSMLSMSSIIGITVLSGCGSYWAAPAKEQPPTDNKQSDQKVTTTSRPKLTLATSANYPPYEFHDTLNGKNQIFGFDIDIAQYIAKDQGFDLEIKDMDFNQLIPALQSHGADFVLAGMSPDPDRLKNADFSDPYYGAENTIISKKSNNFSKLQDLVGRKVGVQQGTIQEGAAKNLKGVEVVTLNTIPEMIQEIKSNHIDAGIIEGTVAKGYIDSAKEMTFHNIESNNPNGSAVAFPKDSTHIAQFNQSIKKMKDNGELDKLIKKWFEK